MTDPLSIVAVIGSLRADSANRHVFEAAVELIERATLTEVPIREVPLFDQDLEDAGDPPSVAALRSAVEQADGLVFFTPEYNVSIPAVTKNVIDWLSRKPGDSVISRAVVGAVATTPGRHDARGVRDHLGQVLAILTPTLYEPLHAVSSIRHRVSDGRLADEQARAELADWLQGFVDFAQLHRRGGATG